MPLIVGPGSAVEERLLIATSGLSDAATLSVVGADPITGMEVANLQTRQLYERWRAVPTDMTLQLTCDFGAARAFRLVSLIGTNATADMTWRVTAGTSAGTLFSGPDVLDTMLLPHWPVAGLDTWERTLSFLLLDAALSARYVGIELGALPAVYEAGRLYIADPFIPTYDVGDGDSLEWLDPSPMQQVLGGQTFVDPRGKRRKYSFSLRFTSRLEAMASWDLERMQGLAGDVLVCRDPRSATLHHETFYGHFGALQPLTNQTIGLVEHPFVIEELI